MRKLRWLLAGAMIAIIGWVVAQVLSVLLPDPKMAVPVLLIAAVAGLCILVWLAYGSARRS